MKIKTILPVMTLLSVMSFATNELNSTELSLVKENVLNMKKMDKVDEEIRILDVSIEKHRVSIYKKFEEIEMIFDNYECEKQKVAINQMNLLYKRKTSPEESLQVETILNRLKNKLNDKCGGE